MEKICPVTKILSLLSKKWNLVVLRQLDNGGTRRFNELLGGINGVSSRTLSKRLKELEKAGILKRAQFNEIPPRVEYSLTQSGSELIKCFKYLNHWVEKYG